jgi:hypothetical protein
LYSVRVPVNSPVELRIWCVVDVRLRLALVLEAPEEVEPVSLNRSAKCRAELLVRIWQYFSGDRIFSIEAIVPEITGERTFVPVRARLGNRVDLHAHRATLARIHAAGVLEFGNCVTTVARLPEAQRHHVGDLLAIQVHLHADAGRLRRNRNFAHRVDAAARREHRQVHPVATLDRQLLHLTRVDVSRCP